MKICVSITIMLEPKRFQRKKEDFVCRHCEEKVEGSGYTDHCPKCLWSRHIDVHPGDRQAACKGMMKPISAEKKGDGHLIHYRCQKCNYLYQVKAAENDVFEEILKLAAGSSSLQ